MPLYWFILLPLSIGLVSYLSNTKHEKLFILLLQFALFLMAIFNFIDVRYGDTKLEVIGGYRLGVGISLKSDLFSSVMILLTIFLFTCLLVYNLHKSYMNSLFLFLFLVLQGLICGLFLSNDLFNIYVIVEVSTIVVSILIVYKKDSKSIYDGMIYLFTNLASMTLFLLGIGYMYKIFGTTDLSLLEERMALIENPKVLILPFVLMVTAVDLKSAIMPLFSWLPKAHGTASAPSIISGVLSGLYVKGGVYLFIRITALFEPVFDSTIIFLVFGFLTAVIGFIFALSQTDIKLILAYHTVSQIGLIVFGLSIDSTYSHWGAIYHIVNHAIFKTTLFLTAGIIIEEYKTRDITKIHGVLKRMPYVSIATIFAILGITGAPLFNGAFSKYLIQKGTGGSIYFEIALFIINLGTVMSFVKYAQIFKGQTNIRFKIEWNQKLIILFLAVICFFGGILGPVLMEVLFNYHVEVSLSSYSSKFIIYIVNLVIGYLFYHILYHKIGLFRKIREIELSFNQIVMSIIVFYTGFLAYMIYSFG